MRSACRGSWGLALLLMIAGTSGCGDSTPTVTTTAANVAHVPQTEVHIYAPFSPTEAPLVAVGRTISGDCWTSSDAANRSDAWRCMAGNYIYDPCFAANHAAHFVLCAQDGPWGKLIRMNLTHELPTTESSSPERPPTAEPAWALELTDGAHCVLLEGAGNVLANLRENYKCSDGIILYGTANHTSQPWTIFGRQGSTEQLTPNTIAASWY